MGTAFLPEQGGDMQVALVHDYLNQYGGAERVLEVLHELFPEAPVYTSIYDPQAMPKDWKRWDIRTSFMQRLPWWRRLFRLYLPCYPLAFELFDLRAYDLILSSSSSFAKGVIPPDGAVHLCYCHNTPRFFWNTAIYLEHERVGRLARLLLMPIIHQLRIWDVTASTRVDAFIANSSTVAGRIARFYRREATIIYPPVPVASFTVGQEPGSYFLTGGRLIPYKRFDLAVAACSKLELHLIIYGDGRDRARLESLAGPSVEFRGWVSEKELRQLHQGCRAYIFPGEEDFGITPLEAMACGRPVIAYAAGGALETVVEGKTGIFFPKQEVASLIEALRVFQDANYHPATIRRHAESFDTERFKEQIWGSVRELQR
jgi:glycosyltransferase involved in cell wall biosynthesis